MSLILPEQKFNAYLRGVFCDADEDYMRVENSADLGVPDINICKRGMEVWIEAKVPGRDVILRKEQFAWGIRRAHCGGVVWVLADYTSHIVGWRFPDIHVRPYGDQKHLIVNRGLDEIVIEKHGRMIKKFLFPSF